MSSVLCFLFYSLLFCCRILLIVMTRNSVVIDGGVVNLHLFGKKQRIFSWLHIVSVIYIIPNSKKNSSVFFVIFTWKKSWSPYIYQHFSKEFSLFPVLDNKATIGQNNVRVKVLSEGSEKYFESYFGFFFFGSFDISLFGGKHATGTYVRPNFNMISITVFHFYQLY